MQIKKYLYQLRVVRCCAGWLVFVSLWCWFHRGHISPVWSFLGFSVLLLLLFGCYCLRGNSLFDEIFRNIKMRQHSARNQNQQKNERPKWERYDNDGNNVTVLLFSATAVERFYILTFQWLVCFRYVRIRTGVSMVFALREMWLYKEQMRYVSAKSRCATHFFFGEKNQETSY